MYRLEVGRGGDLLPPLPLEVGRGGDLLPPLPLQQMGFDAERIGQLLLDLPVLLKKMEEAVKEGEAVRKDAELLRTQEDKGEWELVRM